MDRTLARSPSAAIIVIVFFNGADVPTWSVIVSSIRTETG
jgi:hypothetical protein